MRELLGEMVLTQVEVILPYLLWGFILALILFPFILLGRWIERDIWKRELKKGNRLGEIAERQIKRRDDRIKQLTKEIARDEDLMERVGERDRRMVSLGIEMAEVAVSIDGEKLRRRKRA